MTKRESSPMIDVLAQASRWARENTFHKQLTRKFPRLDSDVATERWVLCAAALAIVVMIFAPYSPPIAIFFSLIGVVRLFGILANVTYITLFHGRFHRKPLTSRRRTVVLFLINYAEIIVWFTFFFLHISMDTSAPNVSPLLAALSFSVSNASGIGQSPLSASSTCTLSISLIESVISLFMIIAVLARFIGLLPPMPKNQGSSNKWD